MQREGRSRSKAAAVGVQVLSGTSSRLVAGSHVCPPLCATRRVLQTRSPSWFAEVLSANLKVQLRLGFLRRIAYTLRPGPLGLLLLGTGAAGALLGGGAATAVFLGLLVYAGLGASGGGAAGVAEEAGSAAGDDDVGSVSGVSEASSSLLHEFEEEGEPPSPRQHPGMPTAAAGAAMPPTPVVVGPGRREMWQDALDELGVAPAAVAPRGGERAGRKAAAGPADSAMGSEAGSSWAASLRRRIGGVKPGQ